MFKEKVAKTYTKWEIFYVQLQISTQDHDTAGLKTSKSRFHLQAGSKRGSVNMCDRHIKWSILLSELENIFYQSHDISECQLQQGFKNQIIRLCIEWNNIFLLKHGKGKLYLQISAVKRNQNCISTNMQQYHAI
jgi:hypothetical protein